MSVISPPIPPIALQVFEEGIIHPKLWLWDSWTYSEGGALHLYALALSRQAHDGTDIRPENRNDYAFHIRHFESRNQGNTWKDLGAILTASPNPRSFYSRNVWSGSAARLPDNRKLMGFTGVRKVDTEHPFLQSIGLAISAGDMGFDHIQSEPISCPRRDYDAIVKAGYYLGTKETLGHKGGEDGGPILAWRDPYIFVDRAGIVHCFWSAKTSPKVGAIAHATLIENEQGFEIETLHPPITLPDGDTITQAEVPKIYHNTDGGIYYCLISACDRLYEGQDDIEVTKTLRLYKALSLGGPWKSYQEGAPILPNLPDMFGASIVDANFNTGEFKLIAPITERARPELQLTFAPIQTINIYETTGEESRLMSSHHKIA